MTFFQSVQSCFGKYVTFSGRARRSEFWWFVLFGWASSIVFIVLDSILFGKTVATNTGFESSTDTPILTGLFTLAILLPFISVTVRRLHDRGRSGWWYWIELVPIIGGILLIVWLASKGTEGDNRFGPDPLTDAGNDDQGFGAEPSSVPSVRRD